MREVQIRTATAKDFDSILALNEESVHFLSPLSRDRLVHLHAESPLHLVAEEETQVVAFLLAFRENAHYDSPNYLWFTERYHRFLYIDRVVVGRHVQAKGLGSVLYERAFKFAADAGIPYVTCEFDVQPPNIASERFHAKFGFREVGRQRVADGKKEVSLQVARGAANR